MKPPPELLHEENGAVSPLSLAVLLILALSILFFRPVESKETHLRDGLGPDVTVRRF
jgi:hypothetical protein